MKKLFDIRVICAFATFLAFVACSQSEADDNGATPDTEITFPKYETYTYSADEQITITFDPAEMWSISADQSWVKFTYDGATQSTISGPAGEQEVSVELDITAQESLTEAQTAIITLKIGTQSEAVAEVTQNASYDASDFTILTVDSETATSEATLAWSDNALRFQYIITVEAPFDWVISDSPEWLDTTSIDLSGAAGEQSRLLLSADMANYPAEAATSVLRFESSANSDIYVDFTLHVEDCSDDIFVLDGYALINNTVDFDGSGYLTDTMSDQTSDSSSFTVMLYGSEEPKSYLLECWYEESKVIYSTGSFLYESAEFTIELSDKVANGNFTQYTYAVKSKAGDPAMAQILLFPASMGFTDIVDLEDYLWDTFGGVTELFEEMDPYKFGIVTRDGGPQDASSLDFSFVYGEWATGASLKLLSNTHDFYYSFLELVESPSDLYHLTYDYPSAQSMAMISASNYDGNLETSEVAVSDDSWLGFEYMGDSFQIKVDASAITSYPIEGYVTFKNEGSTLYDYIFQVTVTAAE